MIGNEWDDPSDFSEAAVVMVGGEWDGVSFVKSSVSDTGGCVGVAFHHGKVGVCDTKDHGTGPVLGFTPHEWKCFVSDVKAGEFDPPA
jgi:uncharacterized protein DUF397